MATAVKPRRGERELKLPIPLPTEDLPLRPKIAYTRKSTESKEMQTRSHDQQIEAILAQHPDEILKHFKDDKSGKTFDDRPGFQEMLRWCRLHPQPRNAPGTIVMYDKSRFGRALIPGTEETDWLAYDKARIAFAEIGWELDFVTGNRTGNQVVDRIIDTLDDEQSSDYIRRLKRNVKRGQDSAAKDGYWPRGIAPFPCVRVDARTERVLADALRDDHGVVIRDEKGKAVQPSERVQHGAHVILQGDPDGVRHWEIGAHMLLDGATWREVLGYFDKHVRTARGSSRWTRKGLMKVFTNDVLVGWLHRQIEGELQRVKAKWDPIVDPELFRRVKQEVARRRVVELKRQGRARRPESHYILRNLRCAHCGAKYFGAYRKGGLKKVAGKRYYCHPEVVVDGRLDRETEERARKAGCRTFRIPADQAESAIRDLILSERGTEEWGATMRRMFEEARSHQDTTQVLFKQCEERLKEKQVELETVMTALDKASPATMELILKRIDLKHGEVAQAEKDLEAAAQRLAASGSARERVLSMIKETEQIAQAWDSADPAARQRIIDWWIDHIEVAVQEVPGRTRGTVLQKTLLVWLNTTPNDPRPVPLLAYERDSFCMDSDTSNHRSPLNDTKAGRRGASPSAPATAASKGFQPERPYAITLPSHLRSLGKITWRRPRR